MSEAPHPTPGLEILPGLTVDDISTASSRPTMLFDRGHCRSRQQSKAQLARALSGHG